MFSIEINSHTLVYLALLVIQHHLPTACLNVSLFSSQLCESTFRSCRAMSGPFSSMVNFTVHQFLQRAKRLAYLHSIKCQTSNNNNNSNNGFLFPRHHKQSRTVDSKQISSLTLSSTIELTVEAIENTILQAYSHASRLVCDVNMYQHHQISSLKKMSQLASLQLEKSRIVDYSDLTKHDPDFDSDSDDSNCEEDEYATEDYTDDEDSIDNNDEDYLSDHLFNVSPITFQGMRVFDTINPILAKSYFIVNINGTKKYLHKQTAAWILSNDKSTLSSDRLKRVMTNK